MKNYFDRAYPQGYKEQICRQENSPIGVPTPKCLSNSQKKNYLPLKDYARSPIIGIPPL